MSIYYIKREGFSLKDKYFIYDENEEPILKGSGDMLNSDYDRFLGNFFSMGYKICISNLDGEEQFVVNKEKGGIWQKYDVVVKDKICAVIHRKKNWWRLEFSTSGEYGEYSVEGDVFATDFTIVKDGKTVASVNRKSPSTSHVYKLSTYEEDKCELFFGIAIAIDNCISR